MAKKKEASGDRHRSPHLIRLQPELYAMLKQLSWRHSRPMTWELELALRAWFARHQEDAAGEGD